MCRKTPTSTFLPDNFNADYVALHRLLKLDALVTCIVILVYLLNTVFGVGLTWKTLCNIEN